MTAEHSPLPWSLGWDYQELQLKDADGVVLTEWTFIIPTYEPRYTETKAECDTGDAEYIVRCVNAHDKLVAALSRIDALINAPHWDASRRERIALITLEAIAKARGES